MLLACWSVKGGSGTTVVAASLAMLFASSGRETLLADLAGDVPAVLGLPEPAGDGLREWLGSSADAGALGRLSVDAAPGLSLVPRGRAPVAPTPTRVATLAQALAGVPGTCIVDLGVGHERWSELAAGATSSLLVIRPCYLALRRAVQAPLRPSGVVLIDEPARVLGRHDVEEVLGVPVVATVAFDPSVARAVDAGLLAGRLPRPLARGLRQAA